MLEKLIAEISAALNEEVVSYNTVSGGDINLALKIKTDNNNYFCKYNISAQHSGIIVSELAGLKTLSDNGVRTPKLVTHIRMAALSGILLEWIPGNTVSSTSSGLQNLCEQLITLHSSTNKQYGAAQDNFIGTLHQHNDWYDNFFDFYIESRLMPQFTLAYDNGYLQDSIAIEDFLQRITNIIPSEKPTLIHGDLWSGNYMISDYDNAYLIDPSVSYGHREMDIAMLHLFGGVPGMLMQLYNEAQPLITGWEDRMDIFQLYYLLVHLNMFGRSYLDQVESILSRYA